MYSTRFAEAKNGGVEGHQPLVAVAIDKDKGSQNALKWAVDNLVTKGQTIILVHVNNKAPSFAANNREEADGYLEPTDPQLREIFLPFRCFCTRKNVNCKDVVMENTDVAKAIVDFVLNYGVEKLVIGAQSKGGFVRFKSHDISSSITKGAPDFCTVYAISKGKVSSMRNASRPAPSHLLQRAQIHSQPTLKPDTLNQHSLAGMKAPDEAAPDTYSLQESIKSPFTRGKRDTTTMSSINSSFSDYDMPFGSSGRPSIDRSIGSRLSSGQESLDHSFEMIRSPFKSIDPFPYGNEFSSVSSSGSWSSQDEIEAEMNRLRLELKQTMDMYSTACREALAAKQKAMELHRWKLEEERRLQEARLAEEAALELVEKEKAKCREAIEQAAASKRIAELEAKKRIHAEMKALKEAEERKRALDALVHKDIRYRKYTIEEIEVATEYFALYRKIGEGGYGPVFRCTLDHTPAAVKVLRPDAAQGRIQFQQEIEVLSCIRHPNMVLLLGACPDYGCLVYEYMANGSLEDRLLRKENTPVIPWQLRFRIAAEIATGLLFLHQTKPEPLVHRDLKPANILLDRNYVAKISDVGLARLVPPQVAENVTQYRLTSTAGTFCYIDPEYQQTGMLGVKSDVYSLGIMLLQIITAKSPMGISHVVSRAIEKGTFAEVLDPAVVDWPLEETLQFAEISLKCAELRRRDRPDLGTVVVPELNRLRATAEENMMGCFLRSSNSSPNYSQTSSQEFTSGPLLSRSGYDSSITQSSISSSQARSSS